MRKLLVVALISLTSGAHAQSIEYNHKPLFSKSRPAQILSEDSHNYHVEKIVTCNGIQLPEKITESNVLAKKITYNIEVLDKNKNVNHFVFTTVEDTYSPITITQNQGYLASATGERNPEFESKTNNKPKYYWKYHSKDLTTGLWLVIYPQIKGKNITTNICFEKIDLLNMKKINYNDKYGVLEDTELDLPEIRKVSGLEQVISLSGEDQKININQNVTVKINAVIK